MTAPHIHGSSGQLGVLWSGPTSSPRARTSRDGLSITNTETLLPDCAIPATFNEWKRLGTPVVTAHVFWAQRPASPSGSISEPRGQSCGGNSHGAPPPTPWGHGTLDPSDQADPSLGAVAECQLQENDTGKPVWPLPPGPPGCLSSCLFRA